MAKIGIIISSLFAYGGEERVVSLMANELCKYHDITIYTFENRKQEGQKRNDYYLSEKINVQEVGGEKDSLFQFVVKILYYRTGLTEGKLSGYLLKNAFYPKRFLEQWVRRINEEKFDVMLAVSGANTMLLGYISERICAKCISWEHSSFEGYFAPKTGYYRNRMNLYSECASKMNRIVVLNQDIADKYRAHMNLAATVIPNPKSFSSEEKADMSSRCFVTCGRVEREKGYDDLIKAFGTFHSQNPEWDLLIIGGGSLQKSLEELADECGVGQAVTFTGYTGKVRELLLKGSVFVMTSRWEGFPMTITEALEMGLPVIGYGIPALEPLITDGVEGRIVPPFERTELVKAMQELADSQALRKQMSEKAIQKAEQLCPENIAKYWMKLIMEVGMEER